MRYPNIRIFTAKPQVFGKKVPDLRPIDIAVNAFQRFKGLQLFNHLQTAEIAGMPNLIALFKVFKNGVVEVAVGVGKEAYFNQLNKNVSAKVIITDRTDDTNNVPHIILFSRYFSLIFNTMAVIRKKTSISK